MALIPEIIEAPQSSHKGESSFITALQGGPKGSPRVAVPTIRMCNPSPQPQGYMKEEPSEGERLVLRHVKEEAEEVGEQIDSVLGSDAVECEEWKSTMDSAFWERVSALVKNKDNTDVYMQPDAEVHEHSYNLHDIARAETNP
jgi:hypothetical protein